MTSITGILKGPSEAVPNNDKLVNLFRDRAKLKKEFAALRDEKHQLHGRIKEHQGATARAQQKMDHLESLLLDHEWVHNVVACYQLRRLEAHCATKLARFAERLKQKGEQRVQSEAHRVWNAQREERAATVKHAIFENQLHNQVLEDQVHAERHKLTAMNIVKKLYFGRRLKAEIGQIIEEITAGHESERQLMRSLDDIDKLDPPGLEGLDNAAKRSINFMILAFAQHLYLHFAEDDLAVLAREAVEKSVGAVNYGAKHECDLIVERIEERWDSIGVVSEYADILQQRSKLLADHAQFECQEDVIPISGTIATVYAIDKNGVVMESTANMLGDNYFGVVKVLSR